MKAIIGLGNPGSEYDDTRHNVGREIVSRLAKLADIKLVPDDRLLGIVGKGNLHEDKVTFLLPDTFMNKSGKSVLNLKPNPKNLIVIHDDSDIPFGIIKIAFGRNSAGHKGVESIMRSLKTKDFWRIRVGVAKKRHVPALELVLTRFKPDEKKIIAKAARTIFDLLEKPLFATTVSL